MRFWIGILLLISGSASLVFNEFTVQVRRVWPWRRDESDPVRDEALNEYYRISVYLGSVASIEIGAALAHVTLPLLATRLLVYIGFAIWLIWRRPNLRQKRFWLDLPFRGTRQDS